jgi:hypothetical protein
VTALVLALTACGGSDPRCSAASCDVAVNACNASILGMPTEALCPGPRPTNVAADRTLRCVEACNAGNNGALIECLGTLRAECEAAPNASDQFRLVQSCPTRLPEPNCARRCDATFATCRGTCTSMATFDECSACLRECGLRHAVCRAGC